MDSPSRADFLCIKHALINLVIAIDKDIVDWRDHTDNLAPAIHYADDMLNIHADTSLAMLLRQVEEFLTEPTP